MSSYSKVTKNPATGKYEVALWIDDYFGNHIYGVSFPDGKVYPAEYFKEDKHKTLWAEDVKLAFIDYVNNTFPKEETDTSIEELTKFMNLIETQYKKRWERDPTGGQGAVEYYLKGK